MKTPGTIPTTAVGLRSRRRLVGRLVAAALLALPVSATLATPAGATTRPCALWLEPTSDRENILWPEVTTTYEAGLVPVLPGGYTEISGQFPHARFFSFQTSGVNGRNITGWADDQIKPDPGSSNPFLPGADRTVTHRSYTLRVLDAQVPASGPAPNTLYGASADGTVRSVPGTALATLRYYLPDLGMGRTGGVTAPTVTMVTPTGQRIPTPTCPDRLGDPGYTQTIAATGPQTALPPGGGPLVAHRTPVWRKFVNAPTAVAQWILDTDTLGTSAYDAVKQVTSRLPAGFFENIYNKYVTTTISTDFGQVLVFRAKLPTTPRTFDGEPRMGTGQVRFWSMCTGDAETTLTYGCAVDKDAPVDKHGYFTIAISTAAARPANATTQCGVAWLPAGPPGQSLVIMRNMVPAAGFKQAIQNVTPGNEQATMGAYYPVGRYYQTTAEFERLGCPKPTRRTSGHSSHATTSKRGRRARTSERGATGRAHR
jgi:hypothetical protein